MTENRIMLGKRVLVTGAGSGIGAASARRLFDEGARVALCDLDEARLADTVQRLKTRLAQATLPLPGTDAVLESLADELRRRAAPRLHGGALPGDLRTPARGSAGRRDRRRRAPIPARCIDPRAA